MMSSSTFYVVAMVIAATSIQAAPISLTANYTGIAPYLNNTNSTNDNYYTYPEPGVSLAEFEQEHTNVSSVADSISEKKDDRLPTGVIVIFAVGAIVVCGGLAWLLHHIYNEFA